MVSDREKAMLTSSFGGYKHPFRTKLNNWQHKIRRLALAVDNRISSKRATEKSV